MMVQLKDIRSSFFLLIIFLFSCKENKKISREAVETIECAKLKEQMKYITQDSVTLQLTYMAYACGDCHPQYRIDNATFSEESKQSYYFNKEINVEFVDKSLEKEFANIKCSKRCYSFNFTGIFQSNHLGMMRLKVTGGRIVLDQKCCDTYK